MAERAHLPDRRPLTMLRFTWNGPSGSQVKLHAGIGFYDDDKTRIGEVFLNSKGVGTDMEVLLKDSAILVSLLIQHGVPLDTIRHSLLRRSETAGEGPIAALLEIMCGPLPAEAAQ